MRTVGRDIAITLEDGWVSDLADKVARTKWEDWGIEPRTIFRVPKRLRDNDPGAYEPMMVALGPYHHDTKHLQPVNEVKWHYLKLYLEKFNPQKELAEYLKELKALENRARIAYVEKLDMSSKEFVEMMLLDGCFVVVTVIYWATSYGGLEVVKDPISTSWSLPVIARDMLILENQLPFFILQTLCPGPPDILNKCVLSLLKRFVNIKVELPPDNKGVFHHILHLFHSSIIPEKKPCSSRPTTFLGHILNWIKGRPSPNFERSFTDTLQDDQNTPVLWIPCATQLSEAGVQFKMKKNALSFLDITFENGKMEIPKVSIDNNTNALFGNLIAFEQCFRDVQPHVTAYASLMDCIIDTAADVALLQQDGIIIGGVGDSKGVAVLFNKLCKNAVLFKGHNNLDPQICGKVNDYCNTKYHKWRARLNHDYFSCPWAMLSLFAAFFIFVLTATQTIYTVLGYVRPPK